jgi:hypothetical protein
VGGRDKPGHDEEKPPQAAIQETLINGCPRSHGLLALAVVLLLAFAIGSYAYAAETAREAVGKPVEAAQLLIRQKKYREALAQLHSADMVRDKTRYEQYLVDDTRAAALVGAGDDPGAAAALEAVLANGELAPPERLQHQQSLIELEFRSKSYAKLVQHGQAYLHDGGNDEPTLQTLAQAYFLQGDFADAAKTANRVLADERHAGRPPSEALLQLLANSEYQAKDAAGYIAALEQLLTVDARKEYWADAIGAVARKPGFAERLNPDLDRLRLATGTLGTAEDYTAAAERALLANRPGDAQTFLDRGFAAGVLGVGPQAGREKRLRDMATAQATDDAKQLAAAEPPSYGPGMAKLGDAYASYGRYKEAIAAYDDALAKGRLDHPDDVRLHLGIACLAAGQADRARVAFEAIAADDGSRDLARLWLIAAASGKA